MVLVLVLVAGSISEGDQLQLEERLYKKLERFCDNLEDFNEGVTRKRESLERHAASLRFIADEMDKVHKDVTEDVVFWSSISVGGDLIHAGGIILDYMGKASPMVSVVGLGISCIGGYLRESACSSEQDHQMKNQIFADKTFKECEEDLQEISTLYRELQGKAQDLAEEEGLSGTKFQKMMMEIKIRLSYLQPARIEKKYSDLTSHLLKVMLALVSNSEQILAVKDTFLKSTPVGGSQKSEAISPVSQQSIGEMPRDASLEPLPRETDPLYDGASKEVAAVPRKKENAKYLAKAVTAAASLYQDGKELYKGIMHLNEGARSELAKNLREVAAYLENVILRLGRILPKEDQGSRF